MFRFAGNRLTSSVQARLQRLRQYACLREATNPEAQQQAIAAHLALAQKVKLTPQQLTEQLSVIQLAQLDKQSNFPNRADYQTHIEELQLAFRSTQYTSNDLHKTAEALSHRIGAVQQSQGKQQAAQELYEIYLKDVNLANFKSEHYAKEVVGLFRERTEERIANLNVSDEATRTELAQTLRAILAKFETTGGAYIGLIKSYVDVVQGKDLVAQSTEKSEYQRNQEIFQRSVDGLRSSVYTAEDKEYAKNVDEIEFKQFLQEVYEKEYHSGFAQNRYNAKNQKLVYESTNVDHHVLRYQILAAVFGGLFLYMFYRGDAYYTTIVTVPLVAAGFFYLAKQNEARRAIPVVRQILKNNDSSFEVIFEQNRTISRIENVSSFKLNQQAQPGHALLWGRPTDDGYHVLINNQSFIVPYQYNGNSLDFRTLVSL